MKKIAFVLPCYNETEVLPLFHAALMEAVDSRSKDFSFEFIYVNDGSSDGTHEMLLKMRESDPRITVLSFSKNYGHEIAATAGLDLAHESEADATVLMDTDLQDPPAVAMAMLEKWESGIDVVYGQRRTRNDSQFKTRTASVFYWLLTRLSETEIPPQTSNFRVLDRRALTAVVKYRESDRFLRGIVSHIGFNQEPYLFDRPERAAGTTHYTLRHMVTLAKTAIFGFSTYPLKAITRVGAVLAALAFFYAFFAIGLKIFQPETVLPGWTFIVVAMLFLGGVQMFMLGIMGHYVGRTYTEVLGRPLYIVESIARTRSARTSEVEVPELASVDTDQ